MISTDQAIAAAKVLAFAIGKGGCGKTLSTVNIAYELVQLGKRVLVVDVDPQTNATRNLGVEPDELEATLYEALAYDEGPSIQEVIVETKFGVDVVPGHEAMGRLEATAESMFEFKLREALGEVNGYDFVFIDCPPALGKLTLSALIAASGVLIPVKPGEFEFMAFFRLIKEIAKVRSRANPTLELEYVLLTDFDARTKICTYIKREIKSGWKAQYLGKISRTTKATESQVAHEPLALFAPNATATSDYREIAATIAERSTRI